jgi:hypothetical protein
VWHLWHIRKLKVWQVLFLLTPLMLWLAWVSYRDFTRLEEDGGVMYVGRTTALLYDVGGKWAVVAFPLVVAGFWLYAVVVTLRLSRRAQALANAADPDYVPPAPPPAALPRAVATGTVPAPRKLEPLPAAAPAAPAPASGDAPRLLR